MASARPGPLMAGEPVSGAVGVAGLRRSRRGCERPVPTGRPAQLGPAGAATTGAARTPRPWPARSTRPPGGRRCRPRCWRSRGVPPPGRRARSPRDASPRGPPGPARDGAAPGRRHGGTGRLGGDGVHGPVLHQVAFGQVAGHVGVSEPSQHGQPPGVAAYGAPAQHGFGGPGIDVAEVTRQPVLVEPGLPADGREAGTAGGPRQDERPDIGVPMPPGHVGSDTGEAGAGPLGVRPGDNGGLDQVHRLPGLPAALLRAAAAPRRRGGVAGELSGAGPLAPHGAARTHGGIEDEA
jgi:hypothetical protein